VQILKHDHQRLIQTLAQQNPLYCLQRAPLLDLPVHLREEVEKIIEDALVRKADETKLRRDARAMREKLASQFPAKDRWNLKFASGGLVDIEFCVQYLQLLHGFECPAVLRQNTVAAIENLSARGFLAAVDTADLLSAAHLQLALLQILRIAVGGRFDVADASEGMKTLLVRTGEAKDFAVLESRLADVQARARGVFEKLFCD